MEKMVTFTESEMLDYWKTRLGLISGYRDCSVEREDGVNLDAQVLQRIREWYANILSTSQAHMLPCEDIASKLQVSISSNNVIRVQLPNNVIRPVEVKMKSWNKTVTTFYEPDDFMASLQYNEYTRGRQYSPVAILLPQQLLMYSASDKTDILESAICAVIPPDGTYTLAESLLSTIPDSL